MEIRWYAFPPFSLIVRCLSKVKREKVSELILVAPACLANTTMVLQLALASASNTTRL